MVVKPFGDKNRGGRRASRGGLASFDPIREARNSKRISSEGVTGACRCGIGPVPQQNKIF